jgi:type III secretory pathway component EscT
MLRALPMVWVIPAFGGPAIPAPLRLALAIALSGLCLPVLSSQAPVVASLWAVLVFREVLVGGVIGFICACWFRAAEAAGSLIDAGLGTSDATWGSPIEKGTTGPFASLTLLLATVIFFEIGGIGHMVTALARSYEAIPVFADFSPGSTSHSAAIVAVLSSAKLIESALGLCAPMLVSLLMAELALGLLARAVPRLSIAVWGAPLKALLGAGVLLLGLGGLKAAMQGSLVEFFALVRSATEAMR